MYISKLSTVQIIPKLILHIYLNDCRQYTASFRVKYLVFDATLIGSFRLGLAINNN